MKFLKTNKEIISAFQNEQEATNRRLHSVKKCGRWCLVSYATIIAYKQKNGQIVANVFPFSQTTSRHQRLISAHRFVCINNRADFYLWQPTIFSKTSHKNI